VQVEERTETEDVGAGDEGCSGGGERGGDEDGKGAWVLGCAAAGGGVVVVVGSR